MNGSRKTVRPWMSPDRPYSIAHRGASDYAPDNTLASFELAHALGADFFEVDLRLSRDGIVVVWHDPEIIDDDGGKRQIANMAFDEITLASKDAGYPIARFSDVLALAQRNDIGIYADIKAYDAAHPVLEQLRAAHIEKAILGAFDRDILIDLGKTDCPYPRATLIRADANPFEGTENFDILHLCWENMTSRPDRLVTPDLIAKAQSQGQQIVLWHEERPDIMARLRALPVLGICSNKPELVNPFRPNADWPVKIVCHRGAERLLPENTTASMHCAFAAGFSHVECDIRSSSDEMPIIMHDADLARTTNGQGMVATKSLADLRKLDAGKWFARAFAGLAIPQIDDVLDIARIYDGHLYLELKTGPVEPILKAVDIADCLDRCFFWSFDRQILGNLRQLCKTAKIMTRRQDYSSLDEAIADLGAAIIEFTPDEDMDDIAQCQKHGVASMIAYMGTDIATFEKIILHRPDYVNLSDAFGFRRCYERFFA